MKKLFTAIVLGSLIAISSQAFALSISPGSQIADGLTNPTNPPSSTNLILDEIDEIIGTTAVELYKQNAGEAFDTGSLMNSYATLFNADRTGGSITYEGGPVLADPMYLLVKDGRNSPYWYFFDLTDLGWDGVTALELSGFWVNVDGSDDNGSISHVSLYGTESPTVPEPGTMMLLGVGMFGLAIFGKRRMNK